MRVCPETLYAWIHSSAQQHRNLKQYLPRGKKKHSKRGGRHVHSVRFPWRVSIHERDEHVNTRTQAGHHEADTILGVRGGSAIHTSVERTSRYLTAILIPAVTAEATLATQLTMYKNMPAHLSRSVTTDNGSEFAWHYPLADTLAIPTYFADPYSPWQRGTNEHFNGRLRKYLPKKTSFETLTQTELDEIVQEINNRPRKILN